MPDTKKKRKSLKNKKKSFLIRNRLALFQVLIILLFVSAGYVLWLDHRITAEFEGKKWSLPARVYASPVELYPGLQIDPVTLISVIRDVGYQRVNQLNRPGEYVRTGDRLVIFTRQFDFWDGTEPSRKLSLEFSSDTLLRIIDVTSNQEIPLTRVEPQLIGKIYPAQHEDRILVAYDEIPPSLIDALVATEDRNYFRHFGIDPKGILRALYTNLMSRDVRQGGSTLTQQLVKNFFLTRERTYWRKFNEMIMAILLERHYSKQEILDAYVNEIYLGQHGQLSINGFGNAAEYYFSRPLQELRLDQLALLVALVRGASYYNPRTHPDRALERRNLVLEQMYAEKYIDEVTLLAAEARPLDIASKPGWTTSRYPAFMDLVIQQIQADYKPEDLRSEGLRIFTTLNPLYQQIMEQSISQRLERIEKDRKLKAGIIEVAGILSNVQTGEILAIVGGRDMHTGGFNRALDAKRQIGSLIKPAIYLTALSHPDKYNAITILDDKPVSIKQADGSLWTPHNYEEETYGKVPLHTALEKSLNLATVNLALELGMPAIRAQLKKLGISVAIPDYPSVFLGALGLSPLQVVKMYQTLASNGFRIPPRAIRDVVDRDGHPLQRYDLDITQTIDSRPVFITNYLLTRVVDQGTARSVSKRLPDLLPLAGKTGTTNDLRDSWFAGFGDDVLGVVWLGRDDNKPVGLTGASGALQVWIDMMGKIKPKPLTLVPPDGVTIISTGGGNRLDSSCPGAEPFPFIEPYLPAYVNCHNTNSKPQSDKKSWSIFDLFQ